MHITIISALDRGSLFPYWDIRKSNYGVPAQKIIHHYSDTFSMNTVF